MLKNNLEINGITKNMEFDNKQGILRIVKLY